MQTRLFLSKDLPDALTLKESVLSHTGKAPGLWSFQVHADPQAKVTLVTAKWVFSQLSPANYDRSGAIAPPGRR
jgi:hypothetical protein